MRCAGLGFGDPVNILRRGKERTDVTLLPTSLLSGDRGTRTTDGRRISALLLMQDPPQFNGQAARLFYIENTFESNVKLERREITCLAAIKGGIWCSSYTYKKSILITTDHTTLRKKI